jgi:hypothetical protein
VSPRRSCRLVTSYVDSERTSTSLIMCAHRRTGMGILPMPATRAGRPCHIYALAPSLFPRHSSASPIGRFFWKDETIFRGWRRHKPCMSASQGSRRDRSPPGFYAIRSITLGLRGAETKDNVCATRRQAPVAQALLPVPAQPGVAVLRGRRAVREPPLRRVPARAGRPCYSGLEAHAAATPPGPLVGPPTLPRFVYRRFFLKR